MAKELKQIAIYGKGGIGKSTTSSNISAALSKMGYKVMQFGCDPKSDSTNTLRGGEYIPTVLDTLRERGSVRAEEVIFEGFNGIYCVEAGGPQPGVGCAGRGIIAAVDLFKQQHVFEELDLDVVIYDVLGDVVCGGFAMPIREGIAKHVFTVSSSDFMSMYASNNLFRGIERYSKAGGALLGGVIANSINTAEQRELIDDFAHCTETQIMAYVPRSPAVTRAELAGMTTIEADPESEQARIYAALAERIFNHADSKTPKPMGTDEMRLWAKAWGERLMS